MCGIAGFWNPEGAPREPESVLRAMTDSLRHRGPDDAGYHWDPAVGLAMGHRRLSIVDLAPTGHQPMKSRSGRFVIVFNGEIYNHAALRSELAQSGAEFRGRSDTEVMLEGIEQWGLARALAKFVGMFAFALWDSEQRELTLARDRFGKKPLYVLVTGGGVAWASELRAFRALPSFDGSISRPALAAYLSFGYVPGATSIHVGVGRIEPGCIATFRSEGNSRLSRRDVRYWSARDIRESGRAHPLQGTDADVVSSLEALLRDAVALRMIADVPLGAFLSGGIDSSLTVALMQVQTGQPVKTFTIGFGEAEYDESAHAAAVARHLGTEHTSVVLSPDEARSRVPRLAISFDEPFGDASQLPTLLVSEIARRDVTVVLSGDGGDEVFCGYNRYVAGQALWRRLTRLPPAVRSSLAAALRAVSPSRWDSLGASVRPFLSPRMRVQAPGERIHKLARVLGVHGPSDFYRLLVTQDTDVSRLVPGSSAPLDSGFPFVYHGDSVAAVIEEMMLADTLTYLPGDILVKVDRATMAVSLEARAPLLDHRVYEFAARMPLRFKLREGVGKWALRQILYRHVPRALVERPKAGFAIPLAKWLRGPLLQWADALLAPARLRREGYLDAVLVRSLWDRFVAGDVHESQLVWHLLMFQAWLDEQRNA